MIIGVSSASGIISGLNLLERLPTLTVQRHLVITKVFG